MRAVLFAYQEVGAEALETLLSLGVEVVGVFTHEDDPGEERWWRSVKEICTERKIPYLTPEDANGSESIRQVKAWKPDVIFSFYYRRMICECILAIPKLGAFNLHGSLLPKYRGRCPVNWVLIGGETETGLTLHYMVKRADAGDIVLQKKVAIAEDDTAHSLYLKLIPLVAPILKEAVPLIASGRPPRVVQDESLASKFGGRKPQDGLIDWTNSNERVYNLVRAVAHPYPGAFSFFAGKKVLIWSARKTNLAQPAAPGTIVQEKPLIVACGENAVELTSVEEENLSEQSAADWAQGKQLLGKKFSSEAKL